MILSMAHVKTIMPLSCSVLTIKKNNFFSHQLSNSKAQKPKGKEEGKQFTFTIMQDILTSSLIKSVWALLLSTNTKQWHT